MQLEMGYTFAYDDNGAGRGHEHSWGEPLWRIGMPVDWLEFRIAVFPTTQFTADAAGRDTTSGIQDLYTGFKIALTPQDGCLPEMALIPQMNLPTGSSAFTSDNVEPGLNWIYAWDVNDSLATGGSTQVNRRVDMTGAAYTQVAQSWAVAYTLSDALGAYTEYFGLFPSGAVAALRPEHYVNGGLTLLASDDVQFDWRAGVGLNNAAADFFTGVGVSIRMK